ncbi:MAG TPA: PPOX class F420-dependent oxidoreductase [Dermatophilaceae bacterium]|nr:PPOX class F420-dependent oxidoreductase [Dermatophilaceae bacterium]
MDVTTALGFARERNKGVLTTIRRDGRPQLSNVMYAVDDAGRPQVSVTSDRAKTRNLLRDARVCLHVTDDSFWQYVVLDGTAVVGEPALDPRDAATDGLVEYYRRLQGEHPDWGDYRAAMVRDSRRLVTIEVGTAYGMLR